MTRLKESEYSHPSLEERVNVARLILEDVSTNVLVFLYYISGQCDMVSDCTDESFLYIYSIWSHATNVFIFSGSADD